MLHKGVNKIEDIEINFKTQFRPQFLKFLEIEIKTKKEDKIRFYQTKEEMTKQIDLLIRKKWVDKRDDELFILPEGEEELSKQLERHSRNYKRNKKNLKEELKRVNCFIYSIFQQVPGTLQIHLLHPTQEPYLPFLDCMRQLHMYLIQVHRKPDRDFGRYDLLL